MLPALSLLCAAVDVPSQPWPCNVAWRQRAAPAPSERRGLSAQSQAARPGSLRGLLTLACRALHMHPRRWGTRCCVSPPRGTYTAAVTFCWLAFKGRERCWWHQMLPLSQSFTSCLPAPSPGNMALSRERKHPTESLASTLLAPSEPTAALHPRRRRRVVVVGGGGGGGRRLLQARCASVAHGLLSRPATTYWQRFCR